MLGKPGSGKGTQSVRLAEKLHVAHVSPGLVLRDMSEHDSFVGRGIKQLLQDGQLVPDGLILWLINDSLAQERAQQGVVFDGFPRSIEQAELLHQIFAELEREVNVVFDIKISDEAVLKRITGRRVCEKDYKHTFHLDFHPPKNPETCDICGGTLTQRDDDTEESVNKRLHVYNIETTPLLEYYRAEGLLCEVDGERGIEEIAEELETFTEAVQKGLEA